MADTPVLTVEEVQEFIRDKSDLNHLLDAPEFSPTGISMAITLAISAYNQIPPLSAATLGTFPNKSLLMSGTLWKLFAGQAALKARNTMNYSDGGVQIPVEEHFPLYTSLAAMFQEDFLSGAKAMKIHLNIEDGWGEVVSDEYRFPIF